MTRSSDPSSANGATRYRERLSAPLSWWLLMLGLLGSVWLIYQHVYGPRVSVPVAAGLFVVGGSVLIAYGRPRIQVAGGMLTAGPARLPLHAVGTVEVLHGEAARTARGRDLSPTAYYLVRGYITPVIRIEVVDDDDPTPYWLLSSRRPERLAAVIGAAREEAGSA
ncbi:DUF3093 domain-containing protein [Phytoactinopolyspora limicola]|uniref:DUF3093 domain-containing protein n=1 Tax=Phytoactinopolyspora limicola TaxID=2715536 RepID=UPI0014092597|nr:DUF3093 domain-containing protein [Phytoactinopolyspora limicola]